MRYIGIDIGTTSICGAVIDTKRRRIIASITKDNRSFIRTSRTWERIQDTEKIITTAENILTSLLRKYPNIRGIGVTGQMHGIVYVDKNGNAASPLMTWQDGRAGLPYRKTTYAGSLSAATGYAVAPGFGMATHYYNIITRCVPKNASSFCTIQDHLVMRLTGANEPRIDATNAASFGVFNLRSLRFDERALQKAGIGAALLPKIVPSGIKAGTWRGIPVYTALGDNQASFLGSVKDICRTALINIGTGAQISAYTERYAAVPGVDTRPFPGGGYLLVGASLCGGKSYALLHQFFERTLSFFGEKDPGDIFDLMNALKIGTLAERLTVDTRFAGTRTDASVRGSISNISMDNLTPEHLIVGFCDGMTDELYDMYNRMPKTVRGRVRSLTGSGNGLRKNALLRAIVKERFGHPIRFTLHREEAAVGAALSAFVGSGNGDFLSAGRMLSYENR
ncbi:MAG: FGGY family carbohydrate kinase [Spirochaetota bacterium]